jgi:hypothetical protein
MLSRKHISAEAFTAYHSGPARSDHGQSCRAGRIEKSLKVADALGLSLPDHRRFRSRCSPLLFPIQSRPVGIGKVKDNSAILRNWIRRRRTRRARSMDAPSQNEELR